MWLISKIACLDLFIMDLFLFAVCIARSGNTESVQETLRQISENAVVTTCIQFVNLIVKCE